MSRNVTFTVVAVCVMAVLSAAPVLAAGPADLPASSDQAAVAPAGSTAPEECGESSGAQAPAKVDLFTSLQGFDAIGLPDPIEACTGWGTCLQTCTPCHVTKDCPVEYGNVCICSPHCL